VKLTVEQIVHAPIAAVWSAYIDPEAIKAWNHASDDWHTTSATVDFRVGGAFSSRMEAKNGSFGFDFAGVYTAIVPHERIDTRFGDRTATATFSPSEDGVKVRIEFDADTQHPVEQQVQGWQAILDNFAHYVEAAPLA